ncbi:MAG: hypothetical protein ACI9VR_001693 [Cognaticolwellia sp.]|jgi:hypothetical protein
MLPLLLLACGPSKPQLTLAPPNPTTLDTLIAQVEPVDNGFGDALPLEFLWLLEGEETDQIGETLSPAFTERGQAWEVQVWAVDDGRAGRVAWEGAVIQNAPPLVTIAAAQEQSTDTPLSILTTVTDPDGDETNWTVTWLLNGQSTSFTDEVIDADETQAGEEWTAKVQADDGQDESSGQAIILIY